MTDQGIMADGGSGFVCELCQDEHDTRADALRCCSEAFDDHDLDPDRALNCVDEHGSPTVITDGGVDQDDEVEVCPECESSGFQTNVQSEFGARSAESQYLCRECDTRFDEPDTRERQAVGGRRGLAGILEDDDTELATDGGWVKPSGTRGTCIVSDADADLPRHVDPCECASHDGVCRRCGNHITIGPERTEYGHAKGHRSSRLEEDCPHRPDAVNAGNKEIVTDGGRELGTDRTRPLFALTVVGLGTVSWVATLGLAIAGASAGQLGQFHAALVAIGTAVALALPALGLFVGAPASQRPVGGETDV